MLLLVLVPVGKKKQVTYRFVIRKKKAGRHTKIYETIGEWNKNFFNFRRLGFNFWNFLVWFSGGINFHSKTLFIFQFFSKNYV